MSVAISVPARGLFAACWNGPHVRFAERVVQRNGERVLFGAALAIYAALWMLYATISNATVDSHFDVSEASVWAEHLAFGYKHPPMSAWIFWIWFSVFPRTNWAAHLLAVTMTTVALAFTWRLLRDYLDRERALVGIAALMLVPFYTFQASRFNANLVMVPFWPAAILFYLRARRNFGMSDAIFAGVFTALAFLGKYWSIYLIAGMLVTALVGSDVRRFWKSPAPYLMGITAALVVAPHLYWILTEGSHATENFMASSVMTPEPLAAAFARSAFYLGGVVAYAVIPLIFLVALLPSKTALADVLWPQDRVRRQAYLLFWIPLLLPAFVNLVFPHRLTPLWTFPNWALLPVVLFGSPYLAVLPVAIARAGLVALAVSLAAVVASPYVAYARLQSNKEIHETHYRQVADEVARLSSRSVHLIAGSESILQGLPYYLPKVRPVAVTSLSEGDRAEVAEKGMVMVCVADDPGCRADAATVPGVASRTENVTFVRTFLGRSGPPAGYRITVWSGGSR